MRGQSYVPTRWWTERNFIALKPDARRVLLCLWTAPEMSLCGIAALSVATLSERLRIDVPVVNCRLIELQDAEYLTVDPDAFLVWLHGYIDVQLGGPPTANQKWLVATGKALSSLPQTRMVARFRDQYRIPDSLSMAHADSLSHRVSIDTSLPVPSPSLAVPPDAPKFPTATESDGVAK